MKISVYIETEYEHEKLILCCITRLKLTKNATTKHLEHLFKRNKKNRNNMSCKFLQFILLQLENIYYVLDLKFIILNIKI